MAKRTLVPGWNPIDWDCEVKGCFNVKCRPNIEYFAECFPGKIGMSDIDATAEMDSHFVFMEWKSYKGDIPTGQKIYFDRLTRLSKKIIAVYVAGDPETMEVTAIQVVRNGEASGWEECDLEGLSSRLKAWAQKVRPL